VILAVVLVLIVISPFAYFLAPGFVNRKSLAHSVVGKIDGAYETSCKRAPNQGNAWDCSVLDSSAGGTGYRVISKGGGCWDGQRTDRRRGGEVEWPAQISGCVKIGDNVRIFDRIFGGGSSGVD
jgi:hypothetical protein